VEGSLACAAAAVLAGSGALRVHDVEATVRVARVARAVATGRLDWPETRVDASRPSPPADSSRRRA
jgi:dihydropteroate synthase